MNFIDWIDSSKHFDFDAGIPNVQEIFYMQLSPDNKVCWVVGYNAVGCKHSVIFDDYIGHAECEVEHYFGASNESWNTKYQRQERMFESYLSN